MPPARVVVTIQQLGRTGSTPVVIDAMPLAHPEVQPLPDARLLIVGARCSWTEAGAEQNAHIYDGDGALIAAGCLGDGLQHLQTTPEGHIWAGYSDEGVYGNFGWGGPGPAPLGSPGLIRWGETFEPDWSMPSDTGVSIDDCYAMNSSGNELWACTYVDFPIIHVGSGLQHSAIATSGVSGPSAILHSAGQIALIGSYDQPGLITLGEPSTDAMDTREQKLLTMPDGSALPKGVRLHSRGDQVHVFHEASWLVADLAQLGGR